MNRLFALLVVVSFATVAFGALEFVGSDTPMADMAKNLNPSKVGEVVAQLKQQGVEVPKDLETTAEILAWLFDLFGGGGGKGGKGGKGGNGGNGGKNGIAGGNIVSGSSSSTGNANTTPEKKAEQKLKNAYKTLELEKINNQKKSTSAESKNKETIVKVAKSKGSVVQCNSGECCDLSTGMFRLKGSLCSPGPCEQPTKCLGTSEICPPTNNHLEDGTPCQNGSCKKGVCVIGKMTKEQKEAEKSSKKTEGKTQQKKIEDGYVLPTIPESAYPHGSYEAQQIHGSCNSGGCCNLETGKFKTKGSLCSPSTNPCQEPAGVCNGFTASCPHKALPEGSVCKGGKCSYGECIPFHKKNIFINKDNANANMGFGTTTIDIASPQASDILSGLPLVDNSEEIRRLAKDRNKLTNMILMKEMMGFVKNHLEEEKELHDRAYFPFKIDRNTREENADNTFSVHDYIRQMADKKKSEEVLQAQNNLQSNLKSSSSSSSSSSGLSTSTLVAICVGAAFLVIVVAIAVVASGGKKKHPKKLNEEYDKI